MKFEPVREDGVVSTGFWQEWFGGQSNDGVKFVAGTSVMNGKMLLSVKVDGQSIWETVDMMPIVEQWVNRVVGEVRGDAAGG